MYRGYKDFQPMLNFESNLSKVVCHQFKIALTRLCTISSAYIISGSWWMKIKDASHAGRRKENWVPAAAASEWEKKVSFSSLQEPLGRHRSGVFLRSRRNLRRDKMKVFPSESDTVKSSSFFVSSRRWQNRAAASRVWKCCFLLAAPHHTLHDSHSVVLMGKF